MVAMVATNRTPLGRHRGRPDQRVDRRREDRQYGRDILSLAMGPATTRALLSSYYPDSDFRRTSRMNLPLVLFALLVLFCLVVLIVSMR